MNTVRRQIKDAMVAALGHVPGVVHCSAWRKIPLSPTDLPAVIIADTTGTISPVGLDSHQHELHVEAVLMVAGSVATDTVREMAAAMLAAIGADPTLKGLAITCEPTEVALDAEVVGDAVAAARIAFIVTYQTDLWGL